jgi:hypothetical protein
MSLKVQEAPQAPSYNAANIQVPANIATPQATMANVKDQQSQLNSVNTLSGGRRKKRVTKHGKRSHKYQHRSFIRRYKGRKTQTQSQSQSRHQHSQKGGADQRIAIPQVGSICSSGPQCAGAQNASFTAIHNQAQSNSINDAYVSQSGGSRGKRKTNRKNRSHHRRHNH